MIHEDGDSEALKLSRDHRTMVKFDGPNDNCYAAILHYLSIWIPEAVDAVGENWPMESTSDAGKHTPGRLEQSGLLTIDWPVSENVCASENVESQEHSR